MVLYRLAFIIAESVIQESHGRSKSRQDHEWTHDLSHEGSYEVSCMYHICTAFDCFIIYTLYIYTITMIFKYKGAFILLDFAFFIGIMKK
jgi:hypothetical protein